MIIRPAVVSDAEALARLHVQCWRDAYTGLVATNRLAAMCAQVDDLSRLHREAIAAGRTPWLADDGGRLVDFAVAGQARDADAGPAEELYALYVRQTHWGTGLGHRLITAAIGDRDALLWVFRENDRARQFYVRHGFAADGAEKQEPNFGGVEIRMVRAAAD